MKAELIVILGNKNSPEGELSRAAKSRLKTAQEYFNSLTDKNEIEIVTTGGFADYFNESNLPHGNKLKIELVGHGVDTSFFLPHINSIGTIQDAIGVLRLISEAEAPPKKITIITSKYHRARVEIIFSRLFPHISLNFLNDEDEGTVEEKIEETKKIKELDWKLTDIGDLGSIMDGYMDRLHSELKHYDNLSYFPLLGSFSVLFLSYSINADKNYDLTLLACTVQLVMSSFFYTIYLRLAGTAESSRNSYENLCFLLRQPSLRIGNNRFESLLKRSAIPKKIKQRILDYTKIRVLSGITLSIGWVFLLLSLI